MSFDLLFLLNWKIREEHFKEAQEEVRFSVTELNPCTDCMAVEEFMVWGLMSLASHLYVLG